MTRAQSLVAANIVIGVAAFALIATDRRERDTSARSEELRIVGPAKVYIPYANVPQARVKPVERPKPPIAGPDLATGKRVALAQFRGKPVFVSVWGSWNVGSLAQASTIASFARSHGEVAYLGVDSEDSRAAARAFSERFHLDFPTIWDPIGRLGAWAPVPTTLVFDRRHVLVQRIDGSASLAELNAALRPATRP